MKIDKNKKKRIRDLLQFRFDIDLQNENNVKYINHIMSKSYSNFRHRLHNHFLEFETVKEARQSTCPFGLKEKDLVYPCDFFSTNGKYLHHSQINTKHHANVSYSHYGGSKPFIYHLQENSKNISKGQIQGRVDFYHDKKVEAMRRLNKDIYDMHQRCSQLEDGSETVDENVIGDEVLGTRSRYISSMGYGPKPASSSTRKRQPSLDTIALHERISSLREELDSNAIALHERMSSWKEEFDSYRHQMEERMSKFEEQMSQMREFIQQFMVQNSCYGDGTSFSRFHFPPPPPPPPPSSTAC